MACSPHASLETAAIGSLPHDRCEQALPLAFLLDVPTLPQLPQRDAAEYMLPQALEGMPGLRHDAAGMVRVELDRWRAEAGPFERSLRLAEECGDPRAFLPSPQASAALRPFLESLRLRRSPRAKVQLAGPVTVSRSVSLFFTDEAERSRFVDAACRLLGLRARALVQAVREAGARPWCFVDEPWLHGVDLEAPQQQEERARLVRLLAALRADGCVVGLHCCGEPSWGAVLRLPLDILSFDARLSWAAISAEEGALEQLLGRGGRLAFGLSGGDAASQLLNDVGHRFLAGALLTPPCGLAMEPPTTAEAQLRWLASLGRVGRRPG